MGDNDFIAGGGKYVPPHLRTKTCSGGGEQDMKGQTPSKDGNFRGDCKGPGKSGFRDNKGESKGRGKNKGKDKHSGSREESWSGKDKENKGSSRNNADGWGGRDEGWAISTKNNDSWNDGDKWNSSNDTWAGSNGSKGGSKGGDGWSRGYEDGGWGQKDSWSERDGANPKFTEQDRQERWGGLEGASEADNKQVVSAGRKVVDRSGDQQESNVSYSKQDIRNRGAKPQTAVPKNWFERPDCRQNFSYQEEDEDEIFPVRQFRTGINFDDYDKIPVERSGNACEKWAAIARFSEARLHDDLYENVARCGYDRPTPIQKHSIPIIRGGRDLMACAQTGSGKTAAFLIPAIQSLLDKGPPPAPDYNNKQLQRTPLPVVLVLAPTRELASQIFEEGRKFSYNTGIKCSVVYGGAPLMDQKRDVMRGVDILVAAPGRLTHMYDYGWINLGYCRYLVLDEADRMLDMGFEPQVRQIVEQTNMGEFYYGGLSRQTMMFSATFQDEIQILARDFLDDYVFLSVGRVGSTSDLIEQKLMYADEHDKVGRLKRCLKEAEIGMGGQGLALVFVETKKGADVLEKDLWKNHFAVTAIHGNRNQAEREEALQAFRTGQNPILVATDVAARGLDIPNVSLVINYDMPKHIDDYVHRIGRTGRAGRKGKAIAFINEKQCSRDLLKKLNDLLSDSKQERPDWFEEIARVNNSAGGGKLDRYQSGKQTRDLRTKEGNNFDRGAPVKRTVNSRGGESTARVASSTWGASGADDAW